MTGSFNYPFMEENELYNFLSNLSHQLRKILYKIDNGIDLSLNQIDLMKELYLCYRQNNLETLNKFKNGKKGKRKQESEIRSKSTN